MNGSGGGLPKPNEIERVFGRRGALIGMLHLRPLPGAPKYRPDEGIEAVVEQALREGRLLREAGFDGLIVENGWDIPFVPPEAVGHETTAAMAVILRLLRDELSLPIGVNILANAASASIAVAAAGGGSFIRVNQWVNAYVANEGLMSGKAGEVSRYRHAIGADEVRIWADVLVKLGSHALTADRPLAEQVRDLEWFNADAIIVTGRRLADPPVYDDVVEVRSVTDLAVVVGSGVTAENVGRLLAVADAAIVGSALKDGGVWWGEMSSAAVEAIAAARDADLVARR
jgi:membrane complex biogenesis BtpA family protein